MAVFGNKTEETPAPTPGITTEQLMAFAEALKRPSAEETAEKEAKKAQKAARVAQWTEARKAEEANRALLKQHCVDGSGHQKGAGKGTTVSGQIMSDGFFHAICQRCHSTWKFKPTQHLISGGELKDYASLTTETLSKWEQEAAQETK